MLLVGVLAVGFMSHAQEDDSALMVTMDSAFKVQVDEVVLDFGILHNMSPLLNRDQWELLVQDFIAIDSEVRQINLLSEGGTSTEFAERYDCFYASTNETQLLEQGTVLPLDPLIMADPDFDFQDMLPYVLDQVSRDNQIWAMPIDLMPQVLWVNLDLFANVGVPLPTNGWTVDAFYDALTALSTEASAPTAFTPSFGNTYALMLIASFGGLPLDYGNDEIMIDFTSPESLNAIRQVLDLARSGYIDYTPLFVSGGGMSGGGGMPTGGIYAESVGGMSLLSNMRQFAQEGGEGDPFQITTYPRGTQYVPVSFDLGTAFISANTATPEACYRWISYLARHPFVTSNMPTRYSLLDDSALIASQTADSVAVYQAFAQSLQDPNVVIIPSLFNNSLSYSEVVLPSWLNRVFDRYVLEGADLEVELVQAEQFTRDFQVCVANTEPTAQANGISEFEWVADCVLEIDPSMSERFNR